RVISELLHREARRHFGQPARRGLEDLQRGTGPFTDSAFGLFPNCIDVRGLNTVADDGEVFGYRACELFEFGERSGRGSDALALLRDRARLIERGRGGGGVVDANQRPVVEPDDELPRRVDGRDGVECQSAGQRKHDTQDGQNSQTDRHYWFSKYANL